MTDLSLARHIGAILARRRRRSRPGRDRRMVRGARRADRRARPGARPLPARRAARACARRGVHWLPSMVTPYVNTHPARGAAALPRRPGDGAAPRRADALERAGDGDARQPRRERRLGRARRPHRQLRVGGRPVRGRLQPFLPRPRRRRPARRPRLLPAALGARRLRARLPRRAALAPTTSPTTGRSWSRRRTARAA